LSTYYCFFLFCFVEERSVKLFFSIFQLSEENPLLETDLKILVLARLQTGQVSIQFDLCELENVSWEFGFVKVGGAA